MQAFIHLSVLHIYSLTTTLTVHRWVQFYPRVSGSAWMLLITSCMHYYHPGTISCPLLEHSGLHCIQYLFLYYTDILSCVLNRKIWRAAHCVAQFLADLNSDLALVCIPGSFHIFNFYPIKRFVLGFPYWRVELSRSSV